MVVSGNETELTTNAILKWQEDREVECHHPYIAPCKPIQNKCAESFVVAFLRKWSEGIHQ